MIDISGKYKVGDLFEHIQNKSTWVITMDNLEAGVKYMFCLQDGDIYPIDLTEVFNDKFKYRFKYLESCGTEWINNIQELRNKYK